LSINLKEIHVTDSKFLLIGLIILAVAVVGKIIGAFFVKNANLKDKILIGISMIPRGEVGLIFAEFGKTAKIFNSEIYSIMIFVIIITTLIPPILLRTLMKK